MTSALLAGMQYGNKIAHGLYALVFDFSAVPFTEKLTTAQQFCKIPIGEDVKQMLYHAKTNIATTSTSPVYLIKVDKNTHMNTIQVPSNARLGLSSPSQHHGKKGILDSHIQIRVTATT